MLILPFEGDQDGVFPAFSVTVASRNHMRRYILTHMALT